jgi:predicted ATP-grasp superfamily ATP-dependent carboligase
LLAFVPQIGYNKLISYGALSPANTGEKQRVYWALTPKNVGFSKFKTGRVNLAKRTDVQ